HSARLASNLERGSNIATSVGTHYDPFSRGDSLFILSGIPNLSRNVDLAQLEQGVWEQIDAIKKTPPSAEELARVQAQLVAELVYSQDDINTQANRIGALESAGLSWELIDQDVDALKAITPEQISDVARRYLVRERMTRTTVLPLAKEAQQ
ncbi:MAG: insulinase family protein, partial [Pseudomonas neustonica]